MTTSQNVLTAMFVVGVVLCLIGLLGMINLLFDIEDGWKTKGEARDAGDDLGA